MYEDRRHAGRHLAEFVRDHLPSAQAEDCELVVLGLPRGGVPVAYEVAKLYGCPLDVLLVRKLGVPGREEMAFGAIAEGGAEIINTSVVAALGITREQIDAVREAEEAEVERQGAEFRDGQPPPRLDGAHVLLIDDGLATGSTMTAAARGARALGAREVSVAVPVAAPESVQELDGAIDRVLCPMTPARFLAVGSWYQDFSPTEDDEVKRLLADARTFSSARGGISP